MIRLFILVFVGQLLVSQAAMAERIIHKEKSLYRNIIVNEKADRRCLVFSPVAVRRWASPASSLDIGL